MENIAADVTVWIACLFWYRFAENNLLAFASVLRQKLPMKPKRRPANRTINVNHSMNSAGSGDAMYDKAEFSTRIGSMMRETDGAVSKSIIDAAGDRQIPTGMDGGPWMDGRKMNQRAPPPGYICYRCGRKGHFISNCPTIGDKDFDRPRLKRTTGIPKIFLKAVEDPQSSRSGVMIAQTGELVIAQPNDFEWKKLYVKTKNSLVPGNIYELAEKDSLPEYKCSICERLCRDPVSTSCCGKSYCYECINNALVNNEDESKRLICPGCSRSQAPENLMPRDDIQSGIENLLREFLLKQNSVEREQAEKDQLSESDASSVKPSSVDLSNGNFKDGRLDRNGPAGDSGDSSGPTTKTVLNTFQHYALPRRKHVSKPFTIISDLQPSESNLNEKQDLVRTGNEDSECNEVDGSSQEKSEDIEPRVCIPNRPKSSASPFTVMPAGADSASQNEDCSNPNAAVTYSGSFSDTSVKPPETVGTHIVSLASRKRQNPIKIVREAAATGSQQGETQLPPLDSNAPLNSANTGVSNRPQLEAPLFASDSADSSGATQNKRPRLSTDVSSGAAGVAVYQIPGYESSTSLRPLEDVPSAQVLQSSSRPIPTKSSKNPSIPRGKRHASRDFMHGYNPNRNCAVAHQGNDAYINTPRSSPTSTIPILPREFSGSPYDVRFTKPQFHHVSDSKLQDVQLANHVRLRPMSHDIFTTVFSPHSGIPLFNASSDLVLGPTSNSYVRRRFAPKGDA